MIGSVDILDTCVNGDGNRVKLKLLWLFAGTMAEVGLVRFARCYLPGAMEVSQTVFARTTYEIQQAVVRAAATAGRALPDAL